MVSLHLRIDKLKTFLHKIYLVETKTQTEQTESNARLSSVDYVSINCQVTSMLYEANFDSMKVGKVTRLIGVRSRNGKCLLTLCLVFHVYAKFARNRSPKVFTLTF